MTLSELEALLKTVLPEVFHFGAPAAVTRYVVWSEYGSADLVGDDVAQLQIPLVQIDVYAQDEQDTLAAQVITALSNAGQYCTVVGVEFDDETLSVRTILQLQLI